MVPVTEAIWPIPIRARVERYIEENYSDFHKGQAMEAYAVKDFVTAGIFLEWHYHPNCPLKFSEEELKEILKVVKAH